MSAAEYVIRSIVTCHFINLPLEFYSGSFVKVHGNQLQTLYRIQRFSDTKKFKAILQLLDIQCRNAKAVVLKIIRTPLFILKNLFTDQKNSKVVHLVRDPRPTIMSQNFAIQRIKSVSNYAGKFCARILHDITTSDMLTTYHYPGRIIRIHYENLAYHPINMTMQIYKYLNLTFSINVEKKSVLNMKSSDVDRQCFSVYERLGYVPVYNQSGLQNMSIPLFLNRNWKFEFG